MEELVGCGDLTGLLVEDRLPHQVELWVTVSFFDPLSEADVGRIGQVQDSGIGCGDIVFWFIFTTVLPDRNVAGVNGCRFSVGQSGSSSWVFEFPLLFVEAFEAFL